MGTTSRELAHDATMSAKNLTPLEINSTGVLKQNDTSLQVEASVSAKFLELKSSSIRKLSVISEGESSTDGDSRSAVGEVTNRHHSLKSQRISPRGSVASVNSNHKSMNIIHRKKRERRWRKMQKRIMKVTLDPLFDMTITGCILLNTLFLSLEYHNMNPSFEKALYIGNMVRITQFYVAFVFIMVLMLVLVLVLVLMLMLVLELVLVLVLMLMLVLVLLVLVLVLVWC